MLNTTVDLPRIIHDTNQDTIDITVGKKTRYWRYARYAAIGLAANVALWGMTFT